LKSSNGGLPAPGPGRAGAGSRAEPSDAANHGLGIPRLLFCPLPGVDEEAGSFPLDELVAQEGVAAPGRGE
jgi:hypothetical protein